MRRFVEGTDRGQSALFPECGRVLKCRAHYRFGAAIAYADEADGWPGFAVSGRSAEDLTVFSGSNAGSTVKCKSDPPNQTTQKASADNDAPTINVTACRVTSRAGAITIRSHLPILISSSQAPAASDALVSTSAISSALELCLNPQSPHSSRKSSSARTLQSGRPKPALTDRAREFRFRRPQSIAAPSSQGP